MLRIFLSKEKKKSIGIFNSILARLPLLQPKKCHPCAVRWEEFVCESDNYQIVPLPTRSEMPGTRKMAGNGFPSLYLLLAGVASPVHLFSESRRHRLCRVALRVHLGTSPALDPLWKPAPR